MSEIIEITNTLLFNDNSTSEELLILARRYAKDGKSKEAVEIYEQYLTSKPNDAHILFIVGLIYMTELQDNEKAFDIFKKARDINPDIPELNMYIGKMLSYAGYTKLCMDYFNYENKVKANARAIYRIGQSLKNLGQVEKAVKVMLDAFMKDPDDLEILDEVILTTIVHSFPHELTKSLISEHHRIIHFRNQNTSFSNNGFKAHEFIKDKKIKIAFVSPGFRSSYSWTMVEYWLNELIAVMSKDKFEIYCYQVTREEDEHTQKYKKICNFKNLTGSGTDGVAKEIYKDGIDIILDLGNYTPDTCLQLLALKPAPVQISWMSHVSLGLKEVEYLFTNSGLYKDEELFANEEIIDFESTFYRPRVDLPEMKDSPCFNNGFVTFACFNRFEKISDHTLDAWAEILSKVENSRLRIDANCLKDPFFQQDVIKFFESRGISKERLDLQTRKSPEDYYESYNQIDIALDTYPYQGGYTTLDAFCMGTPVISWVGKNFFSKMILGTLPHIHDAELHETMIAYDKEEYIQKAVNLSNNLHKLNKAKTLRAYILDSSLGNIERFKKGFEEQLIKVWNKKVDQVNGN